MKLFTVGPVMMHPEVLEESGKQLPYFRTDEFSELMLESENLLKGLLGTADDSKVAVYMIPTNEELVIAGDTEKIVSEMK